MYMFNYLKWIVAVKKRKKMSINCPAPHPELHQTGVQIFLLCADKCSSFHSFVVTHRKPRRKHILTNTKLFCPCDHLCVESACFLHTPCGFSQPNVNVALPWSPNCQNVCVKKKKKSVVAFWHLLQIFCWWSNTTEISKSHKNLWYYHSSRECSLALIHKCTSTI